MEVSCLKHDGAAERVLLEILQTARRKVSSPMQPWRTRSPRPASSGGCARRFSEAQKGEGGNIKNDVSVPIAKIPLFIARADELVARLWPKARPLAFGHFGDGNVHYNVTQPIGMAKADFLKLWRPLQDAVNGAVLEFGGSIPTEHGIGLMKREALARAKGAVELELMRANKQAFDPKAILNPGEVL